MQFGSKCDWYEHVKKSVEKQPDAENITKFFIIEGTEAADQTSISKKKLWPKIKDFVNPIDVPKCPGNPVKLCEEDLTEKHLYKCLKSIQNDKSLGKDS